MFKKIGSSNEEEERKYLFSKESEATSEGSDKKRATKYGSTAFCDDSSSEFTEQDALDTTIFPTAVIFVLLSKTFEATAANGIRSVLSLFLRDSLFFNERVSIVILHAFNFFSQFLPIFGAILADSYIGNVKTVSFFFIPYAIGYLGIFMSTLPDLFTFHSIVYTSLLLIAVGNGFLRACITALGAHQYVLPEQKAGLDKYFSAYYFFYYAGILMGKILPPYVRSTVLITPFCVETGECYTSVFGVIALTFFISWVLFLCGLQIYKKETPSRDNTMLKTFNCIAYAVFRRLRSGRKANGIMDCAVGRKYSQEFVNDVKEFLRVVKVFLPLPIYYSLLNQQDSTWTFQANLTDTTIFGIQIEADQFKAIGPILLIILIPMWEKIINPLLKKCGIFLSSLECVFIGCIFATLSFVSAGFLQYFIFLDMSEKKYSVLLQFPQFLLIMVAEMLISVPGLKYAYTNSPTSMKSVLTAIFFVNNALGNLVVIGVTQLGLFNGDHSMEFFFYAFLMLAAAVIIKILSSAEQEPSNLNSIANDEGTYETFIYVDEVQTTNMEENSCAI